ncbi:hypothetical protein D3C76_1300870 [compost metagenome]
MQYRALTDDKIQAGHFVGQAGRLVHTQSGVGAVGHQDHHPTHAAGNQRVTGRGGEVDGVGEATRLHQQLGALFAPLCQVFGGGCRGWLQTGRHRVHAPWPDQRDRGMPEVGHGVIARAVGGLLVQLLLHLVHRYLQVKAGQVLPALTVRTVPSLLRRECQAIGQQHRVGRLVEPAAQGRVVVQTILLA